MQIDASGNYQTFKTDPQNIDYYISAFCGFKNTVKALLRKDPDTRTAILEASYKDLLCLRVQAHDILRYLEELEKRKTLQANELEVIEAAARHPDTYGND